MTDATKKHSIASYKNTLQLHLENYLLILYYMKIRNLFIAVLSVFVGITYAQDTISSIVKSESGNLTPKPHYFRVTSRDSVSKKKTVTEYAVTLVKKSELVTKKGESILPETGDWAISIDASPFLRYLGNFIGSNGANVAPTFNFLSVNQTILGKYYVDPEKAYRLGVRLGFGSNSFTNKVSTVPSVNPIVYVDDVTTTTNFNLGLTAGTEWRKGHGRLQGFYGVEGGFVVGSASMYRDYGNKLAPNNPWSRLYESENGTSFSLGARGFIGVDYFLFPKIAIGGEFGWGAVLRTVGEGHSRSEYWDDVTKSVKTTLSPTGGFTSFSLDSDNLNTVFGPAGSIRLILHF